MNIPQKNKNPTAVGGLLAPSLDAFVRALPCELDLYAPCTPSPERERVLSLTPDSTVLLGGTVVVSDRARADEMYSAIANLLWDWRESGTAQRIGLLDICDYSRAIASIANSAEDSYDIRQQMDALRADICKKINTLADDISDDDIPVIHGMECFSANPTQPWICRQVKGLIEHFKNHQVPWLGTAIYRKVDQFAPFLATNFRLPCPSYITFAPERSAE